MLDDRVSQGVGRSCIFLYIVTNNHIKIWSPARRNCLTLSLVPYAFPFTLVVDFTCQCLVLATLIPIILQLACLLLVNRYPNAIVRNGQVLLWRLNQEHSAHIRALPEGLSAVCSMLLCY